MRAAVQTEDTNVFLGLDTNRLARWDMRDPHGLVSQAASPSVITYAGGKDYARGTKFRCRGSSACAQGWVARSQRRGLALRPAHAQGVGSRRSRWKAADGQRGRSAGQPCTRSR